jgi:hypothetical protein
LVVVVMAIVVVTVDVVVVASVVVTLVLGVRGADVVVVPAPRPVHAATRISITASTPRRMGPTLTPVGANHRDA